MKRLETTLKWVSKALLYLAAMAAVLLTVLVILSVFMRYFLFSPFHFTEEVVAFLFVTMVFLTLPFTTAQREHVRVTALTRLLPPTAGRVMDFLGQTIVVAFSIFLCLETYQYTVFAHEIGARSEQTELLLTPWLALMPFSFCIVVLVSVVHLIQIVMATRDSTEGPSPDVEKKGL